MHLIKIVGEEEIADKIENFLVNLGIKGYTIFNDKSKSGNSLHLGLSKKDRNVQIEIITSAHNAEKILQEIRNSFFQKHSVLVYMMDVRIIRNDLFI